MSSRHRNFEDLYQLLPQQQVSPEAQSVFLAQPSHFLALINDAQGKRLNLSDFSVLSPWAITAIAAMSRSQQQNRIMPFGGMDTSAGNFVHAIGFDETVSGNTDARRGEAGRTLRLCRVTDYGDIERVSQEIAHLLVDESDAPEDEYYDREETSKTIAYVMIELLRNVLQHSEDPLGAVVLAQRMDKGKGIGYEHESFVQITVADCGIGIFKSITATRPEIDSPIMALERSLWPRVSGKFFEGQKGGAQNAGLGLFFISEMAKSTAGRLLIASKGAALLLQGDPEHLGDNKITTINQEYPGTLVVFEMPKRSVSDYDALIKKIQDVAYTRMIKSEAAAYIKYANIPEAHFEFVVKFSAENTAKAEEFVKRFLLPRISEGTPIVFNFSGVDICTQSYLHALLFEILQRAKEANVALFAKNLNSAIRDQIRLVEMYTLSE